MEEKVLIEKCIDNNKTAQNEMFKKFGRKFLTVLIRYVGNRAEAEDLLIEGFMKIFNNLKTYRFGGNFEGWARRIMINTALNHLKSKKNFILLFSDLSEKGEFALNNSSEDLTDLEQKNYIDISPQHLLEIIQKLPTGQRIVFNLHVIENYTHKEIAEKLSISEGTLKSNYSRARVKLKNYLNEYLSKRI